MAAASLAPDFIDLAPAARARGTVALPGSKSISNRTLLLAALARGDTIVRGLLDADDVAHMLDALSALGIAIEPTARLRDYRVRGLGGRVPVKAAKLFLGNAGTAFRPLTAVLAFAGGNYELSGVARMHERPIGDLVDALRALGADIDYLGNAGFPPLAIRPDRGDDAAPDRVTVRGDVSSQFTSALLMALPAIAQRRARQITLDIDGELISKPYVAITTNLMQRFGVAVSQDGWRSFTVPAGARFETPGAIQVEGDASTASYFLAAGALGGGPVRVTGVGRASIQGDVGFADVLERMGAAIERGDDWIEARSGPRGLSGFEVDCIAIPDAAMTLAVVALFARGPTTLTRHRKLARQGNGPHRRDGDRARQARCQGRCGRRSDDDRSAGAPRAGDDRHLRRPPDRDVLRARGARRGARAHHGSRLRAQDLSGLLRDVSGNRVVSTPRASADVPVIAVDGPAASGKGTMAAGVAAVLGFHLLDSGSLYRLVALKALEDRIGLADESALADAALSLEATFSDGTIVLDGRDVTAAIREEAVSAAASQVAVHPRVRAALIARQRAFRRLPGLVADGRDMGTVVFPDACLKIFLTASPEERARRRYKQLIEKGISGNIESLLLDIRERDARDTGRAVAPLAPAADAVVLDTTGMSIEDAVGFVVERYRGLEGGGGASPGGKARLADRNVGPRGRAVRERFSRRLADGFDNQPAARETGFSPTAVLTREGTEPDGYRHVQHCNRQHRPARKFRRAVRGVPHSAGNAAGRADHRRSRPRRLQHRRRQRGPQVRELHPDRGIQERQGGDRGQARRFRHRRHREPRGWLRRNQAVARQGEAPQGLARPRVRDGAGHDRHAASSPAR